MNASSAKVTVIIPNWNGMRWLPDCLDGLAGQSCRGFIIMLVDNGSTDGSVEYVKRRYPNVDMIELDRNYGFAAAVNLGIKASRTEYIALLNNDTVPRADWLGSLVETIEGQPPGVGSIASKMLKLSDPALIDDAGDILTWQGAAYKRGHDEPAAAYSRIEEVFSPCAGAALYRSAFFDDVGGFDEQFFAYLEDIDLGLRGRMQGYRCVFSPTAEVVHFGHGSALPQKRYIRFMTRNRLMVLVKNIPLWLLVKNIFRIIYGQLYFFIVYRKPLHSIAGYWDFLLALPHALRERKKNLHKNRLTLGELEVLLLDELKEKPLHHLVWSRMRHLFR